ncbi:MULTISPECIES: substrate-binding periplasmic protein [unclassified Agarivorans]|uniref:substrate-binding periplasmic protein n=1 Tax=unclassified Agarivorans TaxID=2636026 RepID=UPI0026E3800E|nr:MULTISPECIES: transporter substrate-binding domain-containing protein [unclassified Agarivorans]MDO6686611.1 transporter substrate-binding domain-containing protein [Agarivorans sp. 3_MG-2023]MDO6715429.1 transporter substrate-binding domain-containing protein [Agarivorans sp. 2_MG-2023]
MKPLVVFLLFVSSTLCHAKTVEIQSFVFPPYIMVNDQGKAEGIIVELIEQSFQQLNTDADFQISNWARAFAKVKSHQSQGLIPTMRTADREAFFYYPDTAFLLLDQHLITLNAWPTDTFSGDFAELDDYRIGKVRNARISPPFDQALAKHTFDVEKHNSVEGLVKSLLRGRLDMIATDSRQALLVAAQDGKPNGLKLIEPALGQVPVYLAFSKQQVDQEFVLEFDKQLKQLLEQGALAKLEAKYLQ